MNIPVKLLIAGSGLGILGGAGLTANYFLSDNSLASALKKKGHTLLQYDVNKDDDSATWNPIVQAYANSTTKFDGVAISITGGNSNTPSKENRVALKEACQKAVTSSKYDESTSKIAEQFCVTPITIKALIEKEKTVLDSEPNKDEDKPKWDSLVADYLKGKTNQRVIFGTNLTKSGTELEKEKRDALKKGCKERGEKKTYDTNYHTQYEEFVKWCSILKEQ